MASEAFDRFIGYYEYNLSGTLRKITEAYQLPLPSIMPQKKLGYYVNRGRLITRYREIIYI